MSSDLSAENHLNLVDLEEKTKLLLQQNLPEEASLKNPIDIIGDAKAERYEKVWKFYVRIKQSIRF